MVQRSAAAAHTPSMLKAIYTTTRAEAGCLAQSLREVEAHYRLEKQKRQALHNSLVCLRLWRCVQQLGVGVTVRSWPGCFPETVLVRCDRPGQPSVNRTYSFERVYGPAETQEAIFADVCPLLTSLLDGYNVCVMAYGQTGGGKSYTMLGPRSVAGATLPLAGCRAPGVIPRAAEELFRLISEAPAGSTEVDVSVVEVYNNDIFDLLAKGGPAGVPGVKRELVTTKEGRKEVSLLTSQVVGSAAELVRLVHGGLRLRVSHPTLVHADSSRSHLVVTVTVTTAASATGPDLQSSAGLPQGFGCSPLPPAAVPLMQAKLQLVDLAGSECIGLSGVTGLALRETSFINRSLAALADVLGALAERRGHVPYRNSKLTHLLQDSIGGDAKLLVILCVSPSRRCMAETLQGLSFGTRARQVERGARRKRPPYSQAKAWAGQAGR
ncbi:Kinesin-like protein KIF25 [Tupaia chinensis]|uniref:Kinesin-like protein n=1 Tax=Tupaia chinensis TaxID=246437 RepID=L9L1L0_TUPCH|nr:Kinesin-like protein KIF25 [Tupaia chinensis]